jgi:hypothetical protein
MRDAFSQNTKSTMSKRVAEKCSNQNCRQSTGGPSKDPNGFINVGAAAHICAAAPGGKRFDDKMTPKERL